MDQNNDHSAENKEEIARKGATVAAFGVPSFCV